MRRKKYELTRELVKIIDPKKGEKYVFGEYDKQQEKIKKIKRPNIAWEIAWRLLVVCLVIDSGIYAYFKLYKKQDVWEGLKELQYTLLNKKQIHNDPILMNNNEIKIEPINIVKYQPRKRLKTKAHPLYKNEKKPIT